MEKHITATQAVREFSEILNAIRFNGVHYIIERNRKPIARMEPVGGNKTIKSLNELKFLLKSLPKLDEDTETFAKDIENAGLNQPEMPKENSWE